MKQPSKKSATNSDRSNWSILDVKDILFPTDFSNHSEHAMTYVLALATELGATVHFVHVIDTAFRWETQPFEMKVERRPGFTIQDEVEAQVDQLVEMARAFGVDADRH
jgi:nucleotide-binding universal stress UspA family protein